MPARQFLAASLEAAYDRRTRAMGWTAIRDSDAEFYLNGATPQQVRRAVVRWAAENGRPDPCARRTEVGRTRFARLSGSDAADVAAATGLTFGIEIEFRRPSGVALDPETIAAALRDAGVNCRAENYNHSTRPHWKLIHDASSDRELVSPILRGEAGLAEVRTAMRVLRSLGCRVSASEGMHVHIGAGSLDAMGVCRVVEGYFRNRHLFDAVVAPNRRATGSNNYYCSPLNSRQVRSVREQAARVRRPADLTLGGRYFTVNLQALAAHGTVEFRQHQGSLNGTKATAWVRLLLGFFTAATAGDVPQYATVRQMSEAFGVAAPSVDFLERRATVVAAPVDYPMPAAPAAPAPADYPAPPMFTEADLLATFHVGNPADNCGTDDPTGSGFVCTRRAGHDGPHVAHFSSTSLCPVSPWFSTMAVAS